METALPRVNVLVEGATDETVVRRILQHIGLPCGAIYGGQGKNDLYKRLSIYNQAARFSPPWLVVVDLNTDAECAPELLRDRLPNPSTWMHFRVAVRAIEAWLLADAEMVARFLGIRRAFVPQNPDVEVDPKRVLVDLARRSHRREVREDFVPREGSGSKVGPGYSGRLIEFSALSWRPDVAMQYSDSLRRCILALHAVKQNLEQ